MTATRQILLVVLAVTGLGASQGPAVNSIMREKLQHSQKILEAVVTSDWSSLEAHSLALDRLTGDPRWTVFTYPEYAKYSTAFRRAVKDLHDAAQQRDLDKAPQAYVAVSLSCVSCHRYLARARIAR